MTLPALENDANTLGFGGIARIHFLYKASAFPPSRGTRVDDHVTINKLFVRNTAAKPGSLCMVSLE